MRCSTSGMILAAMTMGVAVAGPTHAHRHRHVHEKKDTVDWAALDWDDMGIDWASAYAAGQHASTSAAPVAAPAATSAAPVAPAAAAAATHTKIPSAAVGGVFEETAALFNGLVGIANGYTSFGTPTASSGSEVMAIGNIGFPQGSNMGITPSLDVQPFNINFTNTSPQTLTVVMWNKAFSRTGLAKDADPNLGASVAPVTPILTFALFPGQSKNVGVQDGTQLGFAQATNRIAPSGGFAISWGEVNFMKSGSGYDMSAIQNSLGDTYKMSISSLESPCVSDPNQNYWLNDKTPIGQSDGSCFIAQTKATLFVSMGGE